MAEQIAHDVVKEALSVGAPSSIDDIATSPTPVLAGPGQASTEINPSFENDQVQNVEGGLGRELAKSPFGEKALQAEASGGSDTDTSKPDGTKDSAGGHMRSHSVKKPTTFKSVSVTKSFLAKAAAGGPNIKPGDKRRHNRTLAPESDTDSVNNSILIYPTKPDVVSECKTATCSEVCSGRIGIWSSTYQWSRCRPRC